MKLINILSATPIPIGYRLAFLTNFMREPLLRRMEREYGLIRPEWTVLICLVFRDGLTSRDICEVTEQPSNTISRAVSALLDKDMIRRQIDPKDGRRKLLYLEPVGRAQHDVVMAWFAEAETHLTACLSDTERDTLEALLDRMGRDVPRWQQLPPIPRSLRMTKPLPNPQADRLRALLCQDELIMMPCCFDALSAKLIQQAGFELTFLSGFAASASRIGAPDVGLMSYGEVLDQARNTMENIDIPMMVDGDTGHGNPMNVERTVEGFARAGCAGVMIEDQGGPKRCGHTKGKAVVDREEAYDRIRAAVTARGRADIVIKARTDARRDHGLAEAITRAQVFAELGADIVFIEEPMSKAEMRTICAEVPVPTVANMLEGGQTPILPPAQLAEIGFAIAAYPLACLSAAMRAMVQTLQMLKAGEDHTDTLMPFDELRHRIGFEDYYAAEDRYRR